MKVVRLSALRTGRLYTPLNIPGTHLYQRLSRLHGQSAVGRLCQGKIPLTPSGIEPATFQLLAQCLRPRLEAVTNMKSSRWLVFGRFNRKLLEMASSFTTSREEWTSFTMRLREQRLLYTKTWRPLNWLASEHRATERRLISLDHVSWTITLKWQWLVMWLDRQTSRL